MTDTEFQIASTPIEQGVTFLEASAGTGKTYTISKLVVRLIAEKGYAISSILVMTFTEAATRELKDRIRKAIQETYRGLGDPLTEDSLAQLYRSQPSELSTIERRLKVSLAAFDEAAIFTIHGFCHRILREFAFEGNRLFESTLIKEPTPLWREAIYDYWRRTFYESDGFVSPVLEHQGQTPESVLRELIITNRYPAIEILPVVNDERFEQTIDALRRLWKQLKECIRDEKDTVLALLESGSVFKKPLRDKFPDLLRVIHEDFPTTPSRPWLDATVVLQRSYLSNQLLAKHKDIPLQADIFDLCEQWNDAVSQFLHQHLFHCMSRIRDDFTRTKRSENLLTFDDMLPAILNTLGSENGSLLQARIQGSYEAALIDEFQDTDPQQTELFRRLFISPDHSLFLIGDPKQAIYKFRGADIFSYLDARKLAKNFYTLSKNWRSDPKLIKAVNGLFGLPTSPFLFDEISYLESSAALPGGKFEEDGQPSDCPLKFCYLETEKPIFNNQAKEVIRSAVTKEILQLLSGTYQLSYRAIEPSDIAILTRSNQEAHEVRADLTDAGLPSVIYSDQTVFETEDAQCFQILLHCLLDPGRLDWIRSLYVSSWFNRSAEDIIQTDWTLVQEHFFAFQLMWETDGILNTLDAWIAWSQIKPTLLAQPGGERRLTNLLHLADLTSKTELETQFSPQPLLQWFTESINEPDRERDDFITRLESDDQAIQIVTIHKSKGLQYPIVFVPFAWNAAYSGRNQTWIYHKPNHDHKLVYDNRNEFEVEDEIQFQKEELSDTVRLLYVALTRAEHRCYLFWGNIKGQDRSSIGHLLGLSPLNQSPVHSSPSEAMEFLKSHKPEGIEILDTRQLSNQPADRYKRFQTISNLSVRPITHTHRRGFQISSFSSLATGFKEAIDEQVTEDEESDYHAEDIDTLPTIFSLPKGTVAGNLVHDVLEKCVFTSPASLKTAIDEIGQASLIKDHWLPILCDHLDQVLQTPLQSPSGDIILNSLSNGQCLKECEFHFPTRTTSTRALLAYFKELARDTFAAALPELETWTDYRIDGFLRGFIDLLFEYEGKFYILDWKSNWLGGQIEDYDAKSMEQAIGQHAYFLQYYLYTLAAVRYLQVRVPNFDYEEHFGGVFYLFIRGMNPDHPGKGVFFDRPQISDILKLDRLFQA